MGTVDGGLAFELELRPTPSMVRLFLREPVDAVDELLQWLVSRASLLLELFLDLDDLAVERASLSEATPVLVDDLFRLLLLPPP